MKRAFSNGETFTAWERRNCDLCKKSVINNLDHFESTGESLCDLDEALTVAYAGDGHVTDDEYRRLGLPGSKCTELEEVD